MRCLTRAVTSEGEKKVPAKTQSAVALFHAHTSLFRHLQRRKPKPVTSAIHLLGRTSQHSMVKKLRDLNNVKTHTRLLSCFVFFFYVVFSVTNACTITLRTKRLWVRVPLRPSSGLYLLQATRFPVQEDEDGALGPSELSRVDSSSPLQGLW